MLVVDCVTRLPVGMSPTGKIIDFCGYSMKVILFETKAKVRDLPPGMYLSVLSVGIITSQFVNYLWYEVPVYRGQPGNILVFFGFFLASLALWLGTKTHKRVSGWPS